MRKLFRVIPLTITLTLLIISLVLNLTSKTIIQEIKDETWKAIIPESLRNKTEESTNWIQDIMNQKEVKNFLDKYINSDAVDKVKDKVKETKEAAEKEIKEAAEEFLKEQEEKLDPKEKFALNTYRFITNAKLKGMLMILIGLNILLIALALWSPFKWIKPTAWAMALSGLSILLLTEWLRNTIENLIHVKTITYHALTQPGLILLVGGILIRFIYFVLATIMKVNKDKKEEE